MPRVLLSTLMVLLAGTLAVAQAPKPAEKKADKPAEKKPADKKPDDKAKPPEKEAEPESVESPTEGRLLLIKRGLSRNEAGQYLLAGETQLAALVSQLPDMQKAVPASTSSMAKFQKEYKALIDSAAQLETQFQGMTTQMNNAVNPNQKAQMASVLKGVSTKRAEAQKKLAQMPQHHNTYELSVGQCRKALIESVTNGLKQYNETAAQYEKLKKDPLVDKSLKLIPKTEKPTLGPGVDFPSYGDKLKKLEELIVHDEIDLEADGKTFVAEMKINGKTAKFQVHPLTRATQLSEELAKEAGIVPSSMTPKVSIAISKDEKLSVPEVVVGTMELGELKTPYVRAIILPPAQMKGLPSLGANFFLGRIYTVDAKTKKLKVTRLKE